MKPADLPPATPRQRRLTDPDLLMAGDALLRSARRALELALRTGTPCYVWQNGKIVNIGAAADGPSEAET
jgi:hypothetical protein